MEDFKSAMFAQHQGDYATALRMFRSLASQGWPGAKWALGEMYFQGLGVPSDYTAALTWYRQASDQGHPLSQFAIGTMYDRGLGVTQNYVEAAKWFHRAAEQGYGKAMVNLGADYAVGEGVAQNYIEAYKWFSLAAIASDYLDRSDNQPVKLEAARRRDDIARRLTSAQLTEAQVLVRQWKAKPESLTNANAQADAAPSLPQGRASPPPSDLRTTDPQALFSGSALAAGTLCETKGLIREGQTTALMAFVMQRAPSMAAQQLRAAYQEALGRSSLYSAKDSRWLPFTVTPENCAIVDSALKQVKTAFDTLR
jgi:hypothetical protein